MQEIWVIKKRKDAGIKHLNNPNTFIECLNTLDDVYENMNDYSPTRKRKKNIFDDMIADIITNKKFQTIIKDTTLPASDPLRFRKNLFDSHKNDNNWSD